MNFFLGYYYIYYNGEEFGKFFLVYGLESFNNLNAFNIYPISGKNNVIITSSMYYLPDIFRIEIIRNVNDVNETFIYTNENIIYKNNDYLKFTLPEYNDELEIPTYILSTIYGYDTFGDEIELKVDIVLEYDNPIDFSLNKNYQISSNEKENITFSFDDKYKDDLRKIMSRIYINDEYMIKEKFVIFQMLLMK